MNETSFSNEEWQAIGQAIARLRASVMAVTFGMIGAAGLFVATAWLIVEGSITGATEVGPTLGLLANYFPGYSVTWLGAIIGAFYGALLGAVVGYSLALIYNSVTNALHPKTSL